MIVSPNNKQYTLNLKGKLYDLSVPKVMGILNVTPDSFFSDSRCDNDIKIVNRVHEIINEKGDIIDIGAYSSRPGCDDISTSEEMERLRHGLKLLYAEAPNAVVSVDTFRADVARMCVSEFGVDIINDISGGMIDKDMYKTVAELKVPYILMHMRGTPQNMNDNLIYDNITADMLKYFSDKLNELDSLGVNDVIIDPGFGFSKTVDDNFALLNHLSELRYLNRPLLVGISRKSMIFRTLGITPVESLNGTSVLNTLSLLQGANILRVHDVKQAIECVTLVNKTLNN